MDFLNHISLVYLHMKLVNFLWFRIDFLSVRYLGKNTFETKPMKFDNQRFFNIKKDDPGISLGKETMSLASDCEKLLPEEIVKEVLLIERAIKVNPTRELKGKEIPLEELKEDLLNAEKNSEEIATLAENEANVIISKLKSLKLIKK